MRDALILFLAAAVLIAAGWHRGAEYDEQYTLFLTGGTTRPIWPATAFPAGDVRALQSGTSTFGTIARDLRTTDVHPPLYFWAIALWRFWVGHGLFAARMFSVACSVVSLALIATIARRARSLATMAVLLTLGCYGFAYTSIVARGFALAQMLTLCGIALLHNRPQRQPWLAGTLLGAASFTNYLSALAGCAALAWHGIRHRNASAVIGFAMWLPADLWFFLPQRYNRIGQFPPFEATASLARLARYSAASVFGGLPLYVDGATRTAISATIALLLIGLAGCLMLRWRRLASPSSRVLFATAAVALPVGLLALGAAFNTSPIELRYLAFATPFVALLLAALPRQICCIVLVIQALSLAGMITRPETMQPARLTARAAAALVHDGVVLVPRGNDGVGIVGAFGIEAPPAMRLLVIDRVELPQQIRARASRFPRVVLALLGQDEYSRATLPHMRQAFADACWRMTDVGTNVAAFDHVCNWDRTIEKAPSP